jgi:hypothetical protein
MHFKNSMAFGNANKVVINEDKLDDDTIKRFLISMILTNQWGDDFENTLVEYDDESVSYHISDYLHQIKLLKFSKHPDYRYEVSQAGRRWLDKFNKGETNE